MLCHVGDHAPKQAIVADGSGGGVSDQYENYTSIEQFDRERERKRV